MTARFAGSRTLDERRRRWLASHDAEQPPSTRSPKTGRDSEDIAEAAQVQVTHFPVRKVISPKGWKIASVGLVALLVGSALIAASYLGKAHTDALGPGWKRLFPAGGGGLIRFYQAGLMIVSGQVALLIWWVRSRSLRDFDGQYYVWLWAAVSAIFAGLGMFGEWHRAWSETICWLSSTDFPQREVLCWMLPATLAGGVIWRKLRADMRDCRSSSLVLWVVGICYLGACAFRLRLDQAHLPELTRQQVGASLQMLASVGVFVSFLAHARFVLHVSPEPPAERPSLWAKVMQRVFAAIKKLPKPRLKFGWMSFLKWPKRSKTASAKPKSTRKNKKAKEPEIKTETSPSQSKDGSESEPTPKPASRRKSRQKPAKSRSKPEPAEQPEEDTTEPAVTEAPESDAAKKDAPAQQDNSETDNSKTRDSHPAAKDTSPQSNEVSENRETSNSSASSEPQLRLDQPLDPDMLKGLSKKERRRLRKLHRDAQRKK